MNFPSVTWQSLILVNLCVNFLFAIWKRLHFRKKEILLQSRLLSVLAVLIIY